MILNWSNELGYVGVQPLIRTWGSGGGAAVVPARETGDIGYDQIRASDRTGNGTQLLVYTNPPPGASSSAGTPGQIAFDASGNWYWCYATNAWARIGPGGYSNSF